MQILLQGRRMQYYQRFRMTNTNQQSQIFNSLRLFTNITKSCKSEYRIVGSVLLTAHFNNVFRELHDIDILIDESSYRCVIHKLQEHNFKIKKETWGGFSWIEATKVGFLPIEFFLVGKFHKKYFEYTINNFLQLRIETNYLKPVTYEFQRIRFTGVPLPSCLVGIHESSLNPKRNIDKQLLMKELGNKKVKRYDNINVYFAGIKLPYLYDFFCFLHNIYGGMRVLFGKKWETWE